MNASGGTRVTESIRQENVLSILFISQQRPWPLTSGGNIRTYHVLRALAERFSVTLLTSLPMPDLNEDAGTQLQSLCADIRTVADIKRSGVIGRAGTLCRSVFSSRPAFIVHNFNPLLSRAATDLLAATDFDVVHLNQVDTVPYWCNSSRRPAILDTHNLHHVYYARRAKLARNPITARLYERDSRLLRRYEKRAFERVEGVLVCSTNERDAVLGLAPEANVTVVPNGVDCDYFTPGDPLGMAQHSDFVFVGNMGYYPNEEAVLWFVDRVFPRVRQQCAGARFVVVGRSPSHRVRQLARRWPDVLVTGAVPDVRTFVRNAQVFVVPLRSGAGTRLKVVEAFAMGMATVSTSLGAEGIDYSDGHDIVIADDEEAMAGAVCRLAADPDLRRSMGRRAREKAAANYDWRAIGRQVIDAYDALGLTT